MGNALYSLEYDGVHDHEAFGGENDQELNLKGVDKELSRSNSKQVVEELIGPNSNEVDEEWIAPPEEIQELFTPSPNSFGGDPW